MGSSSEAYTNGIDPVAGGLVWVRRRNGSWWPGRIMGADELSKSCLVSPRSGNPVKLLGREDASIDWYNLEKSKRVKAFRCGEYNECIENAKASAAKTSKKAGKYNNREDAILHALELENVLQPKDHPIFCSRLDRSGGEQNGVTESLTLPHPGKETERMVEESSSSGDMSNSAQELSNSGVSFGEPNQICASKEQSVQRKRQKIPNDSEYERSQVANILEFLKRKNRHRPLSEVLESTTLVSVPVISERLDSRNGTPLPLVSDDKVSRSESHESKRSVQLVVNKRSDSTGVSCENGTLFCAYEDASLIKQKENEISSMSRLPENYSSDKLFDVPFVGDEKYSAALVSSAGASVPKTSLAWPLSPPREENIGPDELVHWRGYKCSFGSIPYLDCIFHKHPKTFDGFRVESAYFQGMFLDALACLIKSLTEKRISQITTDDINVAKGLMMDWKSLAGLDLSWLEQMYADANARITVRGLHQESAQILSELQQIDKYIMDLRRDLAVEEAKCASLRAKCNELAHNISSQQALIDPTLSYEDEILKDLLTDL
ncbi:uncharacterized protein At1g51745-like [Cornus florida]|uniref:uncharacterized protein At1g51745-like n=1 Tax=Cornus florida TaxID=4283 RepID=UPI00289AAD64|nr:uncharacterized protein At1g51745-like [Cornus florida]